jgi:sporulation protein YlmC with PRC-barrel domain
MSFMPQEVFMRSTIIAIGLLASTALVSAASAQTPNNSTTSSPSAASSATTATTSHKSYSDQWRASKLIGLDIYNEQNEKLGDISEILLDKTGKVEGVVIGVGGFLGMGQHDIKVEMSKLKFVDEPVKTSSTTTTTSTTTGAANRAPATTTTTTSSDKKWYPDHAILSGASKDQLKAMPQFDYNK